MTLLMLLMVMVGLLYNPIVRISMSQVLWLLVHIVAMALFYLISLKTPVDEVQVTKSDKVE